MNFDPNPETVKIMMKAAVMHLKLVQLGKVLFPEDFLDPKRGLPVSVYPSLFSTPILPWVPEITLSNRRIVDCPVCGSPCTPSISRYLTRILEIRECKCVLAYIQYSCRKSGTVFNTLSEEFMTVSTLPAVQARQDFSVRAGSIAFSSDLMQLVHQKLLCPNGLKSIKKVLEKERSKRFAKLTCLSHNSEKTGIQVIPSLDSYMSHNKSCSPQTLQEAWLMETDVYSSLASACMQSCSVESHFMIDCSRKFTKKLYFVDPETKKHHNLQGTHLLFLACNEIHQIIGRRFVSDESHDEIGAIVMSIAEHLLAVESSKSSKPTELSNKAMANVNLNITRPEESQSEATRDGREEAADTSQPNSLPKTTNSAKDRDFVRVRRSQSDPGIESSDSEDVGSFSDPSDSSETDESERDGSDAELEQVPAHDAADATPQSTSNENQSTKKVVYVISDAVNNCKRIVNALNDANFNKSSSSTHPNLFLAIEFLPKQDPFHLINRFSKKIKTKCVQNRVRGELSSALYHPDGELKEAKDMIEGIKKTHESVNRAHVSHNYKKEWDGTLRNSIMQIERGDMTLGRSNLYKENELILKILTTSPLESIHFILRNVLLRRVSYEVGMRLLDFVIIENVIKQGEKYKRIPVLHMDILDLCVLCSFMKNKELSAAEVGLQSSQADFGLKILEICLNSEVLPWRAAADPNNLKFKNNFPHNLDPLQSSVKLRNEKELQSSLEVVAASHPKRSESVRRLFFKAVKSHLSRKPRNRESIMNVLSLPEDAASTSQFNMDEASVLNKILLELGEKKKEWANNHVIILLTFNLLCAANENHSGLSLRPKFYNAIKDRMKIVPKPGGSEIECSLLQIGMAESPPEFAKNGLFVEDEMQISAAIWVFINGLDVTHKKDQFFQVWDYLSRMSSNIYYRNFKELGTRWETLSRQDRRKRKREIEDGTNTNDAIQSQGTLITTAVNSGNQNVSFQPEEDHGGVKSNHRCGAVHATRNDLTKSNVPQLQIWTNELLERLRALEEKHPKHARHRWDLIIGEASELEPKLKSISVRTVQRHVLSYASECGGGAGGAEHSPSDDFTSNLHEESHREKVPANNTENKIGRGAVAVAQGSKAPAPVPMRASCDYCYQNNRKCDGSRLKCAKRNVGQNAQVPDASQKNISQYLLKKK